MGAVVLSLSAELEELVAGCDRVLVFNPGSICAELAGKALTTTNLSEGMTTGKSLAVRWIDAQPPVRAIRPQLSGPFLPPCQHSGV